MWECAHLHRLIEDDVSERGGWLGQKMAVAGRAMASFLKPLDFRCR